MPLAEQDWPFLELLLEVADSSVSYRTRYFTTLQPLAVLDLLMADETNPRSLDFQLRHLADLYQNLSRHLAGDLQAMRDALASLRSFDLRELNYPLPGAPIYTKRSRWTFPSRALPQRYGAIPALVVE
jgi:uncharacterized alpha-E superfamily protein